MAMLTTAAIASGIWQFPVEQDQYFNWYAGRSFYYDDNHLGEDINLEEETPVKAIGNGVLKLYRQDNSSAYGFGELYAVIEHDLGKEYEFTNANEEPVKTRYIRSIYGHIRKSKVRGGTELMWKADDSVSAGDVIGYVNDDYHNGGGAEHLHMGILLDRSIINHLGYDTTDHTQAPYFTAPSAAISFLMTGTFENESREVTDRFRTAYLAYGGYDAFGAPWDSGRGEYVHCWPDACGDANRLWLQDFLTEDDTWSQLVYNQYKDTVYPVTERILEYWHSNTGYSIYGPPRGSQVDWTDGFHYQLFDKPDGTSWYIRCSDPGQCNAGQKSALSSALKAALDQTLEIAGADDDSTDLPPPPPPSNGVPCLEAVTIPDAQRPSHTNGLILNGSLTICGAHGWVEHSQGAIASISSVCAPNADVSEGCVLGLNVPVADTWPTGAPSVYRAQVATNYDMQGGSFSLTAGVLYELSFRARADNNPRQVVVVLTPSGLYDHDGVLSSLTSTLASPVTFQVTNTWQTYTTSLTPTSSSTSATLRFFSGSQTGALLLDDISLEEAVPLPPPSPPPPATLLAHYQFENNGLDSSGNEYHGSPHSLAYAPSFSGAAMSLNNNGQTHSMMESPVRALPPDELTLSLWIKPEQMYAGGGSIIDKSAVVAIDLLNLDNGPVANDLKVRLITSDWVLHLVYGYNAVTAGPWQHLALTYDGATARLYHNGSLVGQTAVSGLINNYATNIYIGDGQEWEPFHGLMDEVKIYSLALSAEQI
ncbi:MAG: carbohydrate binding domain-containing protein, partial [Candidatus Kerfeldbacteria bacterium]|nr:carbohydrate binding domain-containing protein [Candidatus Kerfeldbacteria bacterium]